MKFETSAKLNELFEAFLSQANSKRSSHLFNLIHSLNDSEKAFALQGDVALKQMLAYIMVVTIKLLLVRIKESYGAIAFARSSANS